MREKQLDKRHKLKIASASFHQSYTNTISFFSIVYCIAKKTLGHFGISLLIWRVDHIYEKMALMRIAVYCINITLHTFTPMLCQDRNFILWYAFVLHEHNHFKWDMAPETMNNPQNI